MMTSMPLYSRRLLNLMKKELPLVIYLPIYPSIDMHPSLYDEKKMDGWKEGRKAEKKKLIDKSIPSLIKQA